MGLTRESIGRFGLTHREAEILRLVLVAQGHSNKEVAGSSETLHQSPHYKN
jgi:DNA-binding CsgD family transcriptional regulator